MCNFVFSTDPSGKDCDGDAEMENQLDDSADSDNVEFLPSKRGRDEGRVYPKKIRGSPKILVDIIKNLSSTQSEAVKEIDLGSILEIEV